METAEENLYVPESEIASLTPVYPNRTRIVLADGTVAHRPGPPPPGPWVPLHHSWVNPQHLTQLGEPQSHSPHRSPLAATGRW